MTSAVHHSPPASSREAWLLTLPRRRVREATAALEQLLQGGEVPGPEWPLVIAAWVRVDPERAATLLEQWITAADVQGNLTPPSAVICQLAGWVVDALPDPDPFVSRILPGLSRCVLRNFERYDQRGTGLPLWPSEEESLFPAEFSPGRFTVDLAVLLSNEALAFLRLSEGSAVAEKAAIEAEGELHDLEGWLLDQFWNEEQALFYRYEADGQSFPDHSLCGMIPLVWKQRTAEITEGIRPRTATWNPAAWPPRAWILFFVLLQHTPHHGVLAQMQAAGLPAGATDVERAAWTVLLAEYEAHQMRSRGEISSAVHWLESHGPPLRRGLIAAGILLLLGLLGWQVFHRESRGASSQADVERRARQACEEGQHTRAAVLYGQAAQQGSAAYFRYRQAGEYLHLEELAEAETVYRALLLEEPDAPNVRMNLALSVWRQGRREEALTLYRDFAAQNGSSPELAARAQLAVKLIERQRALDQTE